VLVGVAGGDLAAARALGRRGVRVAFAAPRRSATAWSRYVRSFHRTPDPILDVTGFVDALVVLRARFDHDPVLIPIDDVGVEAVSAHAARLAPHYRLLGPSADVAAEILDKARQYDRVREAGVPLPRTWVPNGRGSAEIIAREARFPLVVKPRGAQRFRRNHGLKAFRAAGPADLARVLATFPEGMLVQEQVEARVEDIFEYNTFTDRSGRIAAEIVLRKLDEWPSPYGSAIAAETVDAPDVVELGRRVLAAFGYRGIQHTEFMRDRRTGELRYIELNPRVAIHAGVQPAAGADTVYPAYAEAAGLPVPDAEPRRTRTVWLRPEQQITYARRFRLPARRPDSLPGPTRVVSDLFVPSDPLPLLVELGWAVHRRLRGRRRPGSATRPPA
jgi:predicted ATP-grasp superfamily ATP-dependent carboligase